MTNRVIRWVLVVAAMVVFPGRAAMQINYVGQENNVATWRSTDVPKAYDTDGNGYYGANGYVLYATGQTSNGWESGNPLLHPGTLLSMPAYLGVANNGMDMSAWSKLPPDNWFPGVDNPTLAPGPAVADTASGLGSRGYTYYNELPALNITITGVVPEPGLRIGVMGRGQGNDQLAAIRLQQTAGSGSGDASMNVVNGAAFYFAFFDVTGAQPGDTITILMRDAAGGNDHSPYYGLAIDTIPEPATLGLLAAGALLGLAGRRKRCGRRNVCCIP